MFVSILYYVVSVYKYAVCVWVMKTVYASIILSVAYLHLRQWLRVLYVGCTVRMQTAVVCTLVLNLCVTYMEKVAKV